MMCVGVDRVRGGGGKVKPEGYNAPVKMKSAIQIGNKSAQR